MDAKNRSGVEPIGLAPYYSATWEVLSAARNGDMPELEEVSEIPEVPGHAVAGGEGKKKKKKGGKKGKKGGKKGKKSGKKGKKKGKKKK